jgi:3-oxoacyl-(acyl-carrier-protein) synthase
VSAVVIGGIGAVSPAGWGVKALRDAIACGTAGPVQKLERPGLNRPLDVRLVPAPAERPACFQHPRLRRASAITRFAVSAGLEALGKNDIPRLGIITCVMSGCVQYSRRFYHEVLENPAAASPLLFPETVFNAPGSHLGSVLGNISINYTMVGDPGTFLQGLALGATWIAAGRLDGCLVVGAEEADWVTSESFRMFDKGFLLAEGAGAVYLRKPRQESEVTLECVTDSHIYSNRSRADAAKAMRSQLPKTGVLVDGIQGMQRYDRPEKEAWSNWNGERLSPKSVLGEGLMAASPWQCITAIDALQQGRCSSAIVSVVGCNQQAIGAAFARA